MGRKTKDLAVIATTMNWVIEATFMRSFPNSLDIVN